MAGCAPVPAATTPAATPATSGPPGAALPQLPADSRLLLDFDGSDALAVDGSQAVARSQVIAGAQLSVVGSWDGTHALQFPAVSDLPEPPGLAVLVQGGAGMLPSPGTADFSYGADVRLDAVSTTELDNGDNVLQRGLAADPTQFKLQMDAGRPACTVTGTGGRLMAKAAKRLSADAWFRLRCERSADGLTLTVSPVAGGEPEIVVVQGSAGSVDFAADIPFSIGRKVAPDALPIVTQPDQFNGTIDNVWASLP
jgi:hypothetical protein